MGSLNDTGVRTGAVSRCLWPWVIGGIAFASIDVLFCSARGILIAPSRVMMILLYVPVLSGLLGLVYTGLYLIIGRLLASRLLDSPRALGGGGYVSISLFILLTAALFEPSSLPPLLHRPWIIFGMCATTFTVLVLISLYLRRRCEEGSFLISFLNISVGTGLFAEIIALLRDSPSVKLRSLGGFLLVLLAGIVIILFSLALKRVSAGLFARPWLRRNLPFPRYVAGICTVILIDIALILGITRWRQGLEPSPGPGRIFPNIVLLVMDTARADRLSCYGENLDTTPYIDELAQDGVIFENVISTSPWTIPSHASLFTGSYARTHGVSWKHPYMDDDLLTLAGFLSGLGYSTYGFSNNPGIGSLTGFARGFDLFVEVWRNSIKNPSLFFKIRFTLSKAMGLTDDGAAETNHRVLELLRRHGKRPFFLFVNYIEPHLRYHPPHHFEERYAGSGERVRRMKKLDFRLLYDMLAGKATLDSFEKETLRDLYDGEIAYLDSRIGELVQALGKLGLYDKTVFILTSDHGENLGEHNLIDHQFSIHETLLNVPLIIHYPPALPGGVRSTSLAQNVDIFPTVLSLLAEVPGVEGSEQHRILIERAREQIQGISLLDLMKGARKRPFASSEYRSPSTYFRELREKHPEAEISHLESDLLSIRSGDYKLIKRSDGVRILYDLRQDPREEVNIAESDPELADSLEVLLAHWRNSLPEKRRREEGSRLDSETKEKLRALGYILE